MEKDPFAQIAQTVESQSDEIEKFQEFRSIGVAYKNLIDSMSGMTFGEPKIDDYVPEDVQSFLREYEDAAKNGFERIHTLVKEHELDASKILSSAFRGEEKQSLIEEGAQTNAFRLEEVAPGNIAIFVEPQFFKSLLGYMFMPKAIAARVPNGLAFIMVLETGRTELDAPLREENIPHETQHTAWMFAKEAGVIKVDEQDADSRDALLHFKDEVIARAVSGGSLWGYHHMSNLDRNSPEQAKRLREENPAKVEQLLGIAERLNQLLQEIESALQSSAKYEKRDIIAPLIQAPDFASLEQELTTFLRMIEIES